MSKKITRGNSEEFRDNWRRIWAFWKKDRTGIKIIATTEEEIFKYLWISDGFKWKKGWTENNRVLFGYFGKPDVRSKTGFLNDLFYINLLPKTASEKDKERELKEATATLFEMVKRFCNGNLEGVVSYGRA